MRMGAGNASSFSPAQTHPVPSTRPIARVRVFAPPQGVSDHLRLLRHDEVDSHETAPAKGDARRWISARVP